jgi:putative ABC transport system substrate-binding protein
MRRRVADTLMAVVIVLAAAGLATECHAQVKIPRVGVLAISEATLQQAWYQSFTRGLAERGWVPGKNMVLEYRFARGQDSRFTDAAEKLVQLKVDVIWPRFGRDDTA